MSIQIPIETIIHGCGIFDKYNEKLRWFFAVFFFEYSLNKWGMFITFEMSSTSIVHFLCDLII